MGSTNLRPTKDIDPRQFVSRREFNALLREVRRLSNLTSAAGYYETAGGRVLRPPVAAVAPDKLRFDMSFDETLNQWTLVVCVNVSLKLTGHGSSHSQGTTLIEQTYVWNNTNTLNSEINQVNLFIFTPTLFTGFPESQVREPHWRISFTNSNDVTPADAYTTDTERQHEEGSEMTKFLLNMNLKGDGEFELFQQTPALAPFDVSENPVDLVFDGPVAGDFTFNYEGSGTRRLRVGRIIGVGSPNVILPISLTDENLNFVEGFQGGTFNSGILEAGDGGPTSSPLDSITSRRLLATFSTDSLGNLIKITNTSALAIGAKGISRKFELMSGLSIAEGKLPNS